MDEPINYNIVTRLREANLKTLKTKEKGAMEYGKEADGKWLRSKAR